jgi:hypothetical protein
MVCEFRDIPFDAKDWPDQKWPASLNELVQAWLAYHQDDGDGQDNPNFWTTISVYELSHDHPEWAWKFILATLDGLIHAPNNKAFAILAAGALEDLLAYHGPTYIDEVETEARRSPDFRRLLGGVWQNSMSDEIWQRVLKAAPDRW